MDRKKIPAGDLRPIAFFSMGSCMHICATARGSKAIELSAFHVRNPTLNCQYFEKRIKLSNEFIFKSSQKRNGTACSTTNLHLWCLFSTESSLKSSASATEMVAHPHTVSLMNTSWIHLQLRWYYHTPLNVTNGANYCSCCSSACFALFNGEL